MAVLKEYRCAAHGEFEATEAECPHGCSPRFVVQEFRTAPAVRSNGTNIVDTEMQNLSKAYGLSDIKNGVEGESVMMNLRKKPTNRPSWGEVPHAQPGFSRRPADAPENWTPEVPRVSAESLGAAPVPDVQAGFAALKEHGGPKPTFIGGKDPTPMPQI